VNRYFEEDLETLFKDKIIKDDNFCKELWGALANVRWINEDGTIFECTFRYAGGLIADIRDNGNYMQWYCSYDYATVSDYIAEQLSTLGWTFEIEDNR